MALLPVTGGCPRAPAKLPKFFSRARSCDSSWSTKLAWGLCEIQGCGVRSKISHSDSNSDFPKFPTPTPNPGSGLSKISDSYSL